MGIKQCRFQIAANMESLGSRGVAGRMCGVKFKNTKVTLRSIKLRL